MLAACWSQSEGQWRIRERNQFLRSGDCLSDPFGCRTKARSFALACDRPYLYVDLHEVIAWNTTWR